MEKPQRVTEKCFKHIDMQRKIAVSSGGACDYFIKGENGER